MGVSVAGTETGFQSTASRVENFIAWRPINHQPETGTPPSYSATSELRQLVNFRQDSPDDSPHNDPPFPSSR